MFATALDHDAFDAEKTQHRAAGAGGRARLLFLAYACSPFHGSEKGAGWHRAVQSARFCDTWVICEAREFEDIARYAQEHGSVVGLHFRFVAKTQFERRLERVPGLLYLSHKLWHRRAYRIALQMHTEVPFDLVHHATYCGYREPSYMWRLDAPFVWGPVGGTQNYPWRFVGEAGLKGAALEIIRNGLNTIQLHLSLRVRRAARRADVLLAANSTVRRDLERALGVKTTTMVETGFSPRPCRTLRSLDDGRPLRVLWSGVLGPWKALSLLIKALARLPDDVRYELRVLGEGPERRRCERLARDLGVASHCAWLGWMPLEQAMNQYDWADVFVFTSLRDTTGTVVCEALGAGLPVVCLDHQGVGDMIDDSCGIKIPVDTPGNAIKGLRAAISKLARDRALCRALGEGAVRRARQYEWSYLGERIINVYAEILSRRGKLNLVEGADQKVRSFAGSDVHVPNKQSESAGLFDHDPIASTRQGAVVTLATE